MTGSGDELGGGASAANVELGWVEVVGMRGDSGLTPKSSLAQDKGNRSPGLSWWVRFGLERG
jgi:hypothetical protein